MKKKKKMEEFCKRNFVKCKRVRVKRMIWWKKNSKNWNEFTRNAPFMTDISFLMCPFFLCFYISALLFVKKEKKYHRVLVSAIV